MLHGEGEGVLPNRVSFDGEGGEYQHCRLEKVLVDCICCQARKVSQDEMCWLGERMFRWVC